jgi:hypothetical protein
MLFIVFTNALHAISNLDMPLSGGADPGYPRHHNQVRQGGPPPPLCHPACPGAPWSAPWDLRKNLLNVGHGYEDFRVFPQLAGHFMVVQRLTSLPFSNRIDVEEVMAESETGPNSSDLLRITNSRYTCP